MNKFLDQAHHNEKFLEVIETGTPENFFDWKTTVLFYIALHYIKAIAFQKKINIGNRHTEMLINLNPKNQGAKMPIGDIFEVYEDMFQYSRTSRYMAHVSQNEMTLLKVSYRQCKEHLENLKQYLITIGLKLK